MSFIRQRPMIECTSCGRQVGHLIIPYKHCLNELSTVHDGLIRGDIVFQDFIDSLSEEQQERWAKYNLANYLKPYYEWLQRNESNKAHVMSCAGILANAFLTYLDLDGEINANDVFPLNMNSFTATRYCCLRMLHCDNTPYY